MKLPKTATVRQWQAGVAVSLGTWALGIAIAWTAVTTSEYSSISGITDEGMMDIFMATIIIGCLTGLYIIARLSLLLFSFFLSFTWVLLALAEDASFYIIARCLIGVCSSGTTVAVLVYISEICQDKHRSKIVAWNLVAYYLGILYVSLMGRTLSWQTTAGLCTLPPIFLFIGLFTLPETPRGLLSFGQPKRDKAAKVLQWVMDSNDTEVEQELQYLEKDIAEAQASWRNRWSMSTWKPVLIYLGLLGFSRFSGRNFLVFYSVYFFEKSGHLLEPQSITMILSAVQALATGIGAILLSHLKRKTQLILSQMVMFVVLIILGLYYYLIDNDTINEATVVWLPLFGLFAFLISFHVGVGLLIWVLMVDLCPARVKSVTIGVCLGMYFALGHFENRLYFKWVENMALHGVLFTYAGFAVLGVVYLAVALPETKGKTAQEIQSLFFPSKPADLQQTDA